MRSRWVQSVAYVLLALAIAAGALAFAVLHAWESPHYAGAAPGYRHIALGYQHADGANYDTFSTAMLPALAKQLPTGWRVGMQFDNDFALGSQAGAHLPQIKTGLVFGDFLQGLHVQPLAGRLLTVQEQRSGAPVIVLSQGLAQRWFGSPGAAIGRSVYGSQGQALHVIGVLPAAFTGIEGIFSSHPVQAWVPGGFLSWLSGGPRPVVQRKSSAGNTINTIQIIQILGFTPLLSVPDSVGNPQLQTELARVFAALGAQRPADAQGFAWTEPYTLSPSSLRKIAQRIRLYLSLAIAALALASINVLVLRWLGYLRRRHTLQLERVLGARRGWLLRRLLLRGLLTALALLLASMALIVLGVLLLRHLAGNSLDPVLQPHALLLPLLWILPIVVVLVVLIELLPLLLLLGRERLDGARTVSAGRGDRAFGAVLLAGEVLLGMVMSALAAWAIGYAWQATHQPLGVLDRPATFADFHVHVLFAQSTPPSVQTNQARIHAVFTAAANVIPPGRTLGLGPEFGEGFPEAPSAILAGKRIASACEQSVTPGWITAAGVHLLAGENFAAEHAVPDTALLDARAAEQLFGSVTAAIGRTFKVQNASKPMRVLGVVAPVYLTGSSKASCPAVFEDMRNSNIGLLQGNVGLAVTGTLDAAQQAALRQRLGALFEREHLALSVTHFRSTAALRDQLAAQQITQSHVFIAIALLAWAIALSGIVALLRLYLAQRRRVQAIASALGATPTRTYREVLLGTLLIALIGALLAYLLLPWLATQYALLSGAQVAPYGWPTWIALLVLLAAVFLVAHFPARRAARAEPAQSLHEL